MRLTFHTDYALRVLMLLAMEPQKRHTIAEVARRYDISRAHLMKVAQTLTQAGFVESLRGRGGGLRLGTAPASINLGAVVRATEDNFALVECFDRESRGCVVSPACGLRGPLEEALRAFQAVLDRYSLADLIANPLSLRKMRALLGMPPGRTIQAHG
ncbi:MAG TPA: Rrf2 family transcriptional regulator [Steroidobacteraceae bacterium]|jgi:Rrf2 family nitric oxide-sensitive transcriptional repressor